MKYSTNYTSLPIDVAAKIRDALEELEWTPILICRKSNHPDDHYLYLYIVHSEKDNYIAGLANTSGGDVGLYENHYGCSFKRAMEITMNKIKDCND